MDFGNHQRASSGAGRFERGIKAIFAMAPFPLAPAAPLLVGSMGHLAAQENWTSTFTLINKGVAPSQAVLSFFGDLTDPTGPGPLTLPVILPQSPPIRRPRHRSPHDGRQRIFNRADRGLARRASTGRFRTTRGRRSEVRHLPSDSNRPGSRGASGNCNASSYILAFDNTGGIALGVAVDNVSPLAGNVGVIIRDDKGADKHRFPRYLQPADTPLSCLPMQYPVTAGIRGTIELDTPPGGQISVLGIRFTPPNNALTTIPALSG